MLPKIDIICWKIYVTYCGSGVVHVRRRKNFKLNEVIQHAVIDLFQLQNLIDGSHIQTEWDISP